MTSQELLKFAQALNERDEPYAMVTVVRVAAPTSAYVGAQAIVRGDGTLSGWIGGGCARDIVIAAAKQAITSGESKLVRIANAEGKAEADVEQHAMACASDGTIELFIQPYSAEISLCVVGDTPAAADACFFAQRLGIRLVDELDKAAVVLIATQGTGDAEALARALAGPARHVLMIASRRKADKLREVMRRRGIDEVSLARLQAPAGPDAGAKTPSEIALVAMTGVLASLRGRSATGARHETVSGTAAANMGASPAPGSALGAEATELFVNPVCGIAVSKVTPMHVEAYDGENYYFCCNGCLATFRENPAKYAAIRRASLSRATV